ncbi:MAG: DNA mismatch repair endonuclease MutL [Planctomycetaceae bacterium]
MRVAGSRIRPLDPHVVNQIAAGEVVERPASVVKELVENALDAGANSVEIFAERGGAGLVRVVDDGVGLPPDELELAWRPHATSKLSAAEDLETIATLGFRGEALASIGAISQACILSRVREAEAGASCENRGGVIGPVRAAGAAPGTDVTVHNLFFNTPARARFLRSPRTELGHIEELVQRFALAFPEVAFRLVHDGVELFRTARDEGRLDRIAQLFGRDVAAAMLPVKAEAPAGRLEGFVSRPALTRSHAGDLHFFVNGRSVRDRLLHRIVRDAYRDLLPGGRMPVVFLFLEMDPAQVDVNVHPTKAEVRWRDPRFLHAVVAPALSAALHGADPGPPPPGREDRVRGAVEDFLRRERGVASAAPPAYGLAGATHADSARPLRVLQVHDSYLVCETEEGLLIVDQHALHERLNYDRILARLNEGGGGGQRLLVPERVDVSPADVGLLEERRDLLQRCGFLWSPFGPGEIALEAIPALLTRELAGRVFHDLLELFRARGGGVDARTLFHDVADTLACKASVRFGDALSPEEIAALLEDARALDHASVCPHGRPTAMRLTLADLERHFGRR